MLNTLEVQIAKIPHRAPCVDILGLLEWSLEVKRNSIFNNIAYASALPCAIQPCNWRKTPYHKEMTKTYQMSILFKKMQILSKSEIDSSPNVVEKTIYPTISLQKKFPPRDFLGTGKSICPVIFEWKKRSRCPDGEMGDND